MPTVKQYQSDKGKYIEAAHAAEQKYGIPRNTLVGLLGAESNFNPNAVSPVGARGIAQFMKGTAQEYGIDPSDPFQSIDAAGKYLSRSYKKFGNWEDSLRSYNLGVGGVEAWKAGKRTLPKETKDYVGRVYKKAGINYDEPSYNSSVAPYMNAPQIKEKLFTTIQIPEMQTQQVSYLDTPQETTNLAEETEVEQKQPKINPQEEAFMQDLLSQMAEGVGYVEPEKSAVFQDGGRKQFKLQDERNLIQKDNIPNTKRDLSLMLAEYNNSNKDKEELTTTGQIKNPRSIRYRRNVKPQAELKQDNISTEQRNAQLSPLERPLIYLANPSKILGDLGVPNMETSELDRQAIVANRFNPNQSRVDRFVNQVKLGLGYVPEAAVNTAMAAAFMPEGSGALGLVNETLNPLAGLKTSIPDSMRQGLRTNGLTFKGTPRKYPLNNSQREITEDVERLFKEFPELEKIGNKEEYIKHLENIYPESTQPGIFYRGSNNPNLNVSEWTPNPSGGNNLGQGFYFTPDPLKAEKYGKEAKALLDIKDPTYTSIKLNNNAINMPSGVMTKDLVEDGSAVISIQNPNKESFTGMGRRDEGYMHKYIGDLDNQGFPASFRPSTNYPDYVDYHQVDELAVPSTSQIHILGSEQDLEKFKQFKGQQEPKQFQDGGQIIKDNNGYWNPQNWGKTVEINSPQISMKNVSQTLLGISKESGERKIMKPENEYFFNNTKTVTEVPLTPHEEAFLKDIHKAQYEKS